MPFAIMISTSGLYNSFIDKKDFLDYNYSIATELGSLNTIDDKINMEENLKYLNSEQWLLMQIKLAPRLPYPMTVELQR